MSDKDFEASNLADLELFDRFFSLFQVGFSTKFSQQWAAAIERQIEVTAPGQSFKKDALKMLAEIFDQIELAVAKEYWRIITNVSRGMIAQVPNLLDDAILGSIPDLMDKVNEVLFAPGLQEFFKQNALSDPLLLTWKTDEFYPSPLSNQKFFEHHLYRLDLLAGELCELFGSYARNRMSYQITKIHILGAIQVDKDIFDSLTRMAVDLDAYLPRRSVQEGGKINVKRKLATVAGATVADATVADATVADATVADVAVADVVTDTADAWPLMVTDWANSTISTAHYQAIYEGPVVDNTPIMNYSKLWNEYESLGANRPVTTFPSPYQLANGDRIQFQSYRGVGSYFALWLKKGSMPWSAESTTEEDDLHDFFGVECKATSRGSQPLVHGEDEECFLIQHQDEMGYSLPTPFALFEPGMEAFPVHLDPHLLLPGSFWHRFIKSIESCFTESLVQGVEFEGQRWSIEAFSDNIDLHSMNWIGQFRKELYMPPQVDFFSSPPSREFDAIQQCRDLLRNHFYLKS